MHATEGQRLTGNSMKTYFLLPLFYYLWGFSYLEKRHPLIYCHVYGAGHCYYGGTCLVKSKTSSKPTPGQKDPVSGFQGNSITILWTSFTKLFHAGLTFKYSFFNDILHAWSDSEKRDAMTSKPLFTVSVVETKSEIALWLFSRLQITAGRLVFWMSYSFSLLDCWCTQT